MPCFAAFAQVAPLLAAYDYVADGHGPTEKSAFDVGVGGNIGRCRGWLELAAGVRYDLSFGDRETPHFLAVPLVVAARIPVSATTTLRVAVGAGPSIGFVAGYPDSGDLLFTLGPEAELSVGVIHRSIFVELGVRFERLSELNTDDDYLGGGELVHAQLPVLRAGASW